LSRIGENGIVSIVCHRAEMGQGVRTGMSMIVADELEADWKRVRVVQAPGDEERFGNQDTDGSRSTRHFFEPMRRCGAAARQMLEAAAAARWKVPIGRMEAKEPRGRASSDRPASRLRFARQGGRGMPVPARDAIRLKDPAQFRYIGKGELKLVDGQDIATGKAQYGIDTATARHALCGGGASAVYGARSRASTPPRRARLPGVMRVVQKSRRVLRRPVQSPGVALPLLRRTPGLRCKAARR